MNLSMIQEIGGRRLGPLRLGARLRSTTFGAERYGEPNFGDMEPDSAGPDGTASGQGFEILLDFRLLEVLRPARRLRVELGFTGGVVRTVLDQ